MINAKIVADSLSPQGHRITTMEVVFPRFILAELNTHRMLSKNSASSRAIPFEKMVKSVQENPFIPIAWQKHHKGMQGSEYKTGSSEIQLCINKWLDARDNAVQSAKLLNQSELVTKQLCNRLLEPFMWHKVLITATEWSNFFELRCPLYSLYSPHGEHLFKSKKDAIEYFKGTGYNDDEIENWTDLDWLQINKGQSEIHMMQLAECMWDAMNESTPKQLKAGEWHIPYGDTINVLGDTDFKEDVLTKIKIATARCARVSYTTVGEDSKEIPYEKDIALHDSLIASGHMSPTEHIARAMSDEEYYTFIRGKVDTYEPTRYSTVADLTINEVPGTEKLFGWCLNYRGFIQYRYMI
jgi:thymidylate synthase ThyX